MFRPPVYLLPPMFCSFRRALLTDSILREGTFILLGLILLARASGASWILLFESRESTGDLLFKVLGAK